MAFVSESDAVDGSTGAGTSSAARRPRLRLWTIVWTFALCAGCVMLSGITYERSADALATPETAMYGPARTEADMDCAPVYFIAMGLLALATIKHAFSKVTRALAVLPALAMLPVYAFHRNAMVCIEAVPAFHQNFSESETELDRLADAMESGGEVTLPASAGRFQIIRTERLDSGAVVLITKEGGVFDPLWGFVRDVKQKADTGPATIIGMTGRAGDNHCVQRLSRRWFVLYHHYWFIKRGWS